MSAENLEFGVCWLLKRSDGILKEDEIDRCVVGGAAEMTTKPVG